MSTLPLFLGLACIAIAIGLIVWFAFGGTTAAETAAKAPVPAPPAYGQPMAPFAAYGPGAPVALAAPPVAPPRRRADRDELDPLLKRMRAFALRLSPAGYMTWLRRTLDYAGNPKSWPADRVLAIKGIALLVGGLLGALVGLGHGPVLLLLAIGGATLGFFLPDLLVKNVALKYQADLLKGLPDALDMMTVCVEAGLGFDAALSRVALNMEGPIATEFARVLQETQFGLSRVEALRKLSERTSVTEIRTFVSAIVQSTELGISVGVVLREQAREMRIRRRQLAEEKAQKLQVKIVVPLILCLLPAMFIVVIGPGVLSIIHGFSHHP